MAPMSFPEPHRRALLAGHIDCRKSRCGQALCRAVLLLADLKADIARAELRWPAPDQQLVAALEREAVSVDRFGKAIEPRRLGRHLGLDALARLDPVPAARRHRALFVDADCC